MNQVSVVGRLGKDTELKYTVQGTAVLSGFIFDDYYNKDKQESQMVNFSIFGKKAENLSPYLTKGKMIALFGKLRINRTEEGKTYINILVDDLKFISSGKDESSSVDFKVVMAEGESKEHALPDNFDDDIPF